jgi:hypothetical protein
VIAIDSKPQTVPRYFLLTEEETPDGPRCHDYVGGPCAAIFGFTDQAALDVFRTGIDATRRPYPLLGVRLARAMELPGLQLVVLNARGPHEATFDAATAEAVFAAQKALVSPLTASHRLSLAAGSTAYDVQAMDACATDSNVNDAALV